VEGESDASLKLLLPRKTVSRFDDREVVAIVTEIHAREIEIRANAEIDG
jgi:hypothetical protein